ncbi:hypothetical protein EVG20_g11052 [Dentipellis fragilis]|uniref:Uncharacterized protein n=1 Tax=Dentipellis fragilis TaxID=205917 RepID=A0A4Y9XM09_9AGAM|nr:hypothetical protein EVG20_g11052 [Dentipellis fragilis]
MTLIMRAIPDRAHGRFASAIPRRCVYVYSLRVARMTAMDPAHDVSGRPSILESVQIACGTSHTSHVASYIMRAARPYNQPIENLVPAHHICKVAQLQIRWATFSLAGRPAIG